MTSLRFKASAVVFASINTLVVPPSRAAHSNDSLPHLLHQNGRHELIVDGAPYLILGGQAHNSSAWPAAMPNVWSAVSSIDANTLEVPVYWQQMQPTPNTFDFSIVDSMIKSAREHHVRLVLLWFGTWKNGSSHYLPDWIKAQPEMCPRIIGKTGKRVDSPSPFAPALRAADTTAFRALMHHLKVTDLEHTVILVQVENEPGAWDTIRDYSPTAEKVFHENVPDELISALAKEVDPALKPRAAKGDWPTVFGANADEYFHAYWVAHYIGEVAAAGKAEYPLPLYVNAALRDPLSHPAAGTYESGGATDNVLAIWKAAAPAIDLLAPDIYFDDTPRYQKVLELYARSDNALFVPETGRHATNSRYTFAALAQGAIGFSPFGIDETTTLPALGEESAANRAALEPFAVNYRVLKPMAGVIADLAYRGQLHAFVEEKGAAESQIVVLGAWEARATFGPSPRGLGEHRAGNAEPMGRILVGTLATNQFLVTGYLAHLDFKPVESSNGLQREFVKVEEGVYDNGVFKALRIRNGDETDWGLGFDAVPAVLRVTLGTY